MNRRDMLRAVVILPAMGLWPRSISAAETPIWQDSLAYAIHIIGDVEGSGINEVYCTPNDYGKVFHALRASKLTSNYGTAPRATCHHWHEPDGTVILVRYGHISGRPICEWYYRPDIRAFIGFKRRYNGEAR